MFVRLLVQTRIEVPSVIEWLRPVVLLPITAITRLDEHQLRAVVAWVVVMTGLLRVLGPMLGLI
jgi:hypothetical protein